MEIVLDRLDGGRTAPLRLHGQRAVAFLFIACECPVSNGYAPEWNRICAAYAPKNIGFFVVYAERDVPAEAQRRHARAFGYRCPALRDPELTLARRVGASVTPEAAVLSPGGELLYRGRIDDTYVALGKRRFNPTRHEFRDALDAILRGRPVPSPRTLAVGCALPTPKDTRS